METEIVNRVAQSALITINLEDFYHSGERVVFDMKECLYMGLILREKDFREWVKNHDWEHYNGKNVSIICSADAVVPTWAYMLVAERLQQHAHFFIFGNAEMLENALFLKALQNLSPQEYEDKMVVIKGCFDKPVPTGAYTEITRLLAPYVKSLMYGEPCSTVPIFKRKKT
ncbi:MAG: DUF2480 family protein [Bacteroidota bacterium]